MWPFDNFTNSRYATDIISYLVGAKFLSQGQELHVDQLTPLGDLNYWSVRWGQQLFGSEISGIYFMVWSSAAFVFAGALSAAFQRLTAISSIVIISTLVLNILLPANLGELYWSTVAMHYNKVGFGLLGLIMLVGALPVKPEAWRRDLALLSIFLVALFYIKVTYFVTGLTFAFMALPFADRTPRARMFIALGLLAGIGILAALPHTWNYVSDIYFSGLKSDKTNLTPSRMIKLLFDNWTAVAATLAGLAFLAVIREKRLTATTALWVLIVGGSFAALSQNAQQFVMPSVMAFSVFAFERLRAGTASELTIEKPGWIAIGAAIVMIAYPALINVSALKPFMNYFTYQADFRNNPPTSQPVPGVIAPYRDSGDYPFGTTRALSDPYVFQPHAYYETLSAAAELVRQTEITAPDLFTLDQINGPALFDDFVPSSPWYMWLQVDFVPLPSEKVFSDVDIVLVPFKPTKAGVRDRLIEVYGEDIEAEFSTFTLTDDWLICVRSDADIQGGSAGTRAPCPVRDVGDAYAYQEADASGT